MLQTNHPANRDHLLTRRDWLGRCGGGLGLVGLAALLAEEGLARSASAAASAPGKEPVAVDPMMPRGGHFPAKARSVIWIFINGGPSQVDTWDYKPALERHDGQEMKGLDPETGFFKNAVGPLMKSPFEFTRRGECGKMVSSLFPHLGAHVDKMAFIHSGYTESNNHSPALFMMNTGVSRAALTPSSEPVLSTTRSLPKSLSRFT